MHRHEDILIELRVLRGKLDQIAAMVEGDKARVELLPVWACGHRHANRREAQQCALGAPVGTRHESAPA